MTDFSNVFLISDMDGTLKKWFEDHVAAASNSDGTFGVANCYAVNFSITHGYTASTSGMVEALGAAVLGSLLDMDTSLGFMNKGYFRPVSYEVSLSRREDGLQEVSMTFTQCDTFVKP